MKKLIIIIGIIFLVLNVLLWLLLSFYPAFNMGVNCAVIVLNTILLLLVSTLTMKDGFRVSLSCLFPCLAIAELCCGFASQQHFDDNAFIIAIIIMLVLQIILLIVSNIISLTLKNY